MSVDFANIKWKAVGIGIGIAFLVSIGVTFFVITAYSGYLGFQAQGAPDLEMINTFANSAGNGIAAVFMGVGTFIGGLYAASKADTDTRQNGMMVGVLTAVFALLLNSLTIWTMISFLFALGGGWLSGKLIASRQQLDI